MLDVVSKYKSCASHNVVICEILAFIQYNIIKNRNCDSSISDYSGVDTESLVTICKSAFLPEDVTAAKRLLLERLPSTSSQSKLSQGRVEQDLRDIVQLFERTDPEMIPVYVARDLQRLPVTFHGDAGSVVHSLLGTLTSSAGQSAAVPPHPQPAPPVNKFSLRVDKTSNGWCWIMFDRKENGKTLSAKKRPEMETYASSSCNVSSTDQSVLDSTRLSGQPQKKRRKSNVATLEPPTGNPADETLRNCLQGLLTFCPDQKNIIMKLRTRKNLKGLEAVRVYRQLLKHCSKENIKAISEQLIEAGVIPVLVQGLARRDNRSLQDAAARALGHICFGHRPANIDRVIEAGATPHLVDLLDFPETCESALWTLASIAAGTTKQTSEVASATTIRGLLIFLTKFYTQDKMMSDSLTKAFEYAANVLANISYVAELRDKVIEAVPILVNLLRTKKSNENICKNAAMALLNISCGTTKQIEKVIEASVIPDLLVIINSYDYNDTGKYALKILFNLAYTGRDKRALATLVKLLQLDNKEVCENIIESIDFITCGSTAHANMVIEAGAIPSLVRLLNPANEKICKYAARALGNIGWETVEQKEEVVKAGAIPALIKLLKLSQVSSQIVANAVTTIANTCCGTNEHRDKVIEAGAIPVMVNLIKHHSNKEICEPAVIALCNIAAGTTEHIDKLVELNTIPVFIELLEHLDVTISEHAASAIGNIAEGSNIQRHFLIKDGAITVLKNLLEINFIRPDENKYEKVTEEAVFALANISMGTDDQKTKVIKAGVLPILMNFLNPCHEEVCEQAARAFANIAKGNVDLKEEVIKALPLLIKLLNNRGKKFIKYAVEAVCSIAGGNEEQVNKLIDIGAVTILVNLLESDNNDGEIYGHIIFALEKITERTLAHLNKVIEAGAIPVLMKLLKSPHKVLYTKVFQVIDNIIEGTNKLNENMIKANVYKTIPVLNKLLNNRPLEDVHIKALCTLCSIISLESQSTLVGQGTSKYLNGLVLRHISNTIYKFSCDNIGALLPLLLKKNCEILSALRYLSHMTDPIIIKNTNLTVKSLYYSGDEQIKKTMKASNIVPDGVEGEA